MAAKSAVSIELPPLDVRFLEVTIIGDSPLIVHRFPEKAKKQMLAKQMKKAQTAKEAKDPRQDYLDSLHTLVPRERGGDPEAGPWGFPAIGFKSAAVTAVTSVDGVTKVAARQSFHVGTPGEPSELVQIHGTPVPREDVVRLAGIGRVADLRYRGMFERWWAVLPVRYNARALSAEQVLNLFGHAGFGVGVGEWRPERDGGFGLFHVASEGEVEALRKDAA